MRRILFACAVAAIMLGGPVWAQAPPASQNPPAGNSGPPPGPNREHFQAQFARVGSILDHLRHGQISRADALGRIKQHIHHHDARDLDAKVRQAGKILDQAIAMPESNYQQHRAALIVRLMHVAGGPGGNGPHHHGGPGGNGPGGNGHGGNGHGGNGPGGDGQGHPH